jgi:cytochrome P450
MRTSRCDDWLITVQKVQEDSQKVIDGEYKTSQAQIDLGMDRTIIHALLESDLPPEEKKHSRIWQEAQVVIGAGADTTANTLTVTHFHILDNPDVLKKLQAELEAALPDKFAPVKLSVVDKLPYLVSRTIPFSASKIAMLILFQQNAVIQEGLR